MRPAVTLAADIGYADRGAAKRGRMTCWGGGRCLSARILNDSPFDAPAFSQRLRQNEFGLTSSSVEGHVPGRTFDGTHSGSRIAISDSLRRRLLSSTRRTRWVRLPCPAAILTVSPFDAIAFPLCADARIRVLLLLTFLPPSDIEVRSEVQGLRLPFGAGPRQVPGDWQRALVLEVNYKLCFTNAAYAFG